MASPHQGSLAPNRSAFNFTREGLAVGTQEPSLAMLSNRMAAHPKVLDGLHTQRAVPDPPHILTICHMATAKQHVLYLGVYASVVSTRACIPTHTNTCVRAVSETEQKQTGTESISPSPSPQPTVSLGEREL